MKQKHYSGRLTRKQFLFYEIRTTAKSVKKKGSESLLKQSQKVASLEAFVEQMKYEPHQYGDINRSRKGLPLHESAPYTG